MNLNLFYEFYTEIRETFSKSMRIKFVFKTKNISKSMTRSQKISPKRTKSKFWALMNNRCRLRTVRWIELLIVHCAALAWKWPISISFRFRQILHRLTDVVYFGALKTCKKCKQSDLMFCNWIYKCSQESGWSTCGNEVKEPPREKAEIPPELLTKYPFLRCAVRTRALHPFKFVDEHGNDLIYA